MEDKKDQHSISHTLRPRARLLRTLGDELISDDAVAIIELVKNSYDADATRVLVRFHAPLEKNKGGIEIIDDGNGMSLQTIQSAWMEPATLMKKKRSSSEKFGRRVLGEKGIGRFASSRLTDFLEVVSRRANIEYEIRALFDWSQFDNDQKYLDQIEVLWDEEKPTEISIDGVFQHLYDENLWGTHKTLTPDMLHGTILRMESLRDNWNEDKLRDLRTKLARLVSPFDSEEILHLRDSFEIYIDFPEPFQFISGVVEPPRTLRDSHYIVEGVIDNTGNYDLEISLRGQEVVIKKTGKHELRGGRIPQCGSFQVFLRVWDRQDEDLKDLATKYESTIKDIRRELDMSSGINIYRDGFRVLPYGEPDDDWLRLDLRRVQNPTLRLSNNQIMGYVLISSKENPELRDQSNREGIINNSAMDDLKDLVRMTLALLERLRYNQRHPQDSNRKSEPGGLFKDLDIASIREEIEQRYPGDAQLLDILKNKEKDFTQRVSQIQNVLARYRRLSTLGQLIDVLLHDGRTPLAKIQNESYLGLQDIARTSESQNVDLQKLARRLDIIHNQSNILATVFRRVEPFGGRKRGRPGKIILEQAIHNAFSVLQSEITELRVKAKLPETKTEVTIDESEIQEVIINLLQNSLYWLQNVPKDNRSIIVSVHRDVSGYIEILFSDSGPGVDPEDRVSIFEPYFTSKSDGVGLGLTIAGEIVSGYYDGSLELIEDGPLSGATFRIVLRRRI